MKIKICKKCEDKKLNETKNQHFKLLINKEWKILYLHVGTMVGVGKCLVNFFLVE